MVVQRNRRVPSNGAVTVAAAIGSTPFVEAWEFDQSSGWGTKYAAPGTTPVISPATNGGLAIGFAPDNDQLLFGGRTSSNLYNYPFTVGDNPATQGGYGTPATTSYSSPVDVDVDETHGRILVSGPGALAEYNYSSGAIGSLRWSIATTVGWTAKYIDDFKYIAWGLIVTGGNTDSLRIYDRSTGEPPSFGTNKISSVGTTPKPVSLSPSMLADGSRALAMPNDSTFKVYRVTDGVPGAQITFSPAANPQIAVFDPHGRLITYEASSPRLNIYTQASDGSFTLLDSDTSMDAYGTGDAMKYDNEQDILFVGTQTSPYLGAIRMTGSGFGSFFTALAGGAIPTARVNKLSLMYDEKFKVYKP